MDVSVILPSYNEKSNIEDGVLERVYAYLEKTSWEWELLFADDGSSDGTLQLLEEFCTSHPRARVLALPHRGKGPTVLDALQAATGEVRLFTDFDQATPISEIEKLLPFIAKGYDVVIGSREVQGAQRKKEPFHRHLMGRGFNFFVRLFTIGGIADTQCGFKMFTKRAVEMLVPQVVVYAAKGEMRDAFTGAFDVELLYLAKKYGLKIAEVPVIWKYVKTTRVDPIKDSIRMFKDILRIRWADLTGKYRSQSIRSS